jgi:hypothetical protein
MALLGRKYVQGLFSVNESFSPLFLFEVSSTLFTHRSEAHYLDALTATQVLQQHLPAVGKTHAVAMGKCLSALLEESHFLNLGHLQLVPQTLWNIVQEQSGAGRDTDGCGAEYLAQIPGLGD